MKVQRLRLTDYLCLAANDNWYPAGPMQFRAIGRALGVTPVRAMQLVHEAIESVRASVEQPRGMMLPCM